MSKVMSAGEQICLDFRVTEDEFEQLRVQYEKLCYKAAHQLKQKNSRNNYTEDIEDISQDLFLAMIRAGSYKKRQYYIERCLTTAKEWAKDKVVATVLGELENLWENRKRHGAHRQKFGRFQEKLLEQIVKKVVPRRHRPKKTEPLNMVGDFDGYCKSVVWNNQKQMGKRITREKAIRNGQVSLSEHDYLISL